MRNIKSQKNILRIDIKHKLAKLTKDQIQEKSKIITSQLEKQINNYGTRCLFFPLKKEPQIQDFFSILLKQQKNIVIPQIEEKNLQAIIYDKNSKTLPGRFQIPTIQNPKIYKKKIDIFIIPGLSYDGNNNRLGKGKGYYDRFLSKHKNSKKIGVCFKEQLINYIPIEKHDIGVDEIITD